MSGLELAKKRVEAGHRLRFYQDYYGRQWVQARGGWRFWLSRKIYLHNEEVIELKEFIGRRRRRDGVVMAPRAARHAEAV